MHKFSPSGLELYDLRRFAGKGSAMIALVLILIAGVFAAIFVPTATYTDAMRGDSDGEELWRSFRKSLRVYGAILAGTLLYGAVLFCYGASDEATWSLAFMAMFITPFSMSGLILYGIWWGHLDAYHHDARQPKPAD